MTRTGGSPLAGPAAYAALALAIGAIVVTFVSFRGLTILSVPLSVGAVLLGAYAAVGADTRGRRSIAAAAVAIGVIALVVAVAAIAANTTIGGGYDVYERRTP
jgi:hypothetical protein